MKWTVRMLRYAITSRGLLAPDEQGRRAALVEQARHGARAGLDFFQLREKDLPAGALASLARDLLHALRAGTPESGARPRLIINSRADVAAAVGADGVHLSAAPGSLGPAEVREVYRRAGRGEPIVSVSCHDVAEVERAARGTGRESADLILFGPVFEKRVEGRQVAPGIGLERLDEACRMAAGIPLLALGGVTDENAPACVRAGAAGIAGIRIFLG